MNSLYDYPEVYDQILCHDPKTVAQETNSIVGLLNRHGITHGRILELACGTCSHSIALAKKGFQVTGVDRSSRMLEWARSKAAANGVDIELYNRDVVEFDLGGRFDRVIFMSETFPLITEYPDIRSHFAAVRRHLREAGLYIVDVDAHRHGVGTKYQAWGRRNERIHGGTVEIWNETFTGDWVKGTSRMIMHCRIHFHGRTYETSDEWTIRVDTPWNLEVLIECLPSWTLDGFYSWKDLSEEISEEEHYFMVVR